MTKCEPQFASLINTNVVADFESADGLEEYERNQARKAALSRLMEDDYKEDTGDGQGRSIPLVFHDTGAAGLHTTGNQLELIAG